jgi:hypothetical protein
MPCGDGGSNEREYRNGYDQGLDEGREEALNHHTAFQKGVEAGKIVAGKDLIERDAMLCAVLTKFKGMHNHGQFYDFMETAGELGEIQGIIEWWEEHKEVDRVRLETATREFLRNFSKQEQEVIGTLFKED